MNQELSQLYFLELLIRGLPFDRFSEKEFWKLVDRSSELSSIFQNSGEVDLPILAPFETKRFWKFVNSNDWAFDFLKFVESRKESISFGEFLWPDQLKIVNGFKSGGIFVEAVSVFLWLLTAYQSGDFLGFRFEKPETVVCPIPVPREKGKITFSKRGRRRKEPISPEEAKARRQEYQRQYYLAHREKAKEYQRQYNLLHKKKQRVPGAKGRNALEFKRDAKKITYNTHDIMHSPAEKTLKMLQEIIAGEKMFTM